MTQKSMGFHRPSVVMRRCMDDLPGMIARRWASRPRRVRHEGFLFPLPREERSVCDGGPHDDSCTI